MVPNALSMGRGRHTGKSPAANKCDRPAKDSKNSCVVQPKSSALGSATHGLAGRISSAWP